VSTFTLTPRVDETQEFIEIANDFSNPLDLVREAISNAFDAGASRIEILFDVIQEYNEALLRIVLRDNGHGMDREGLQAFFDLGNSTRRGDERKIGEKGHGTKVYLNSSKISVVTERGGRKLIATMVEPFRKLFDRRIPDVEVDETELAAERTSSTEIIITGYNNNRRDKFTHDILKDYISWFTKFGSFERAFGIDHFAGHKLLLKGLDRTDPELLSFGHSFPSESKPIEALFADYLVRAPDYYCKKFLKTGSLKNHPEIGYQAVFYVEGNRIKYEYNGMLRRQGYKNAPKGAYTVQDRYGVWLAKDFIPVQRKNEWITTRGSEYTKFHAFINCQKLHLTANRGSVENTPSEILTDLESEVRRIYSEIVESDDWRNMSWLEEEAEAYTTTEKEKKDFQWRVNKINRANIANYEGFTLIEPQRETGVFALFVQIAKGKPDLFPFQVIDYDTHEGIDAVVKGDKNTPISSARLFYVEFKHFLTSRFNHSFANVHSVVCWDTQLKHDDSLTDINREERKLVICQPQHRGDYTRYYLDNPRAAHKIEVFVLKDYLMQKLGIEFRPRPQASLV